MSLPALQERGDEPVTRSIDAADRPWAHGAEAVLVALDTSAAHGLSHEEAARRLAVHGPNRLRETARQSAWAVLFHQLRSLMVALLVAAATVSFAFGDWIEGVAIGAAIVLAVAMGFVTELRAIRSMEALRLLGTVAARVRRNGHDRMVAARDLVPGDIVLIEGGDRITADVRVIEDSKLQADESTLTGESVPVSKRTPALDPDTPLAERRNMLYKGTVVTRGSGLGVVVATGMNTELGRIAALVDEATDEITPLERRLEALGRRLIVVSLIVAAVAMISGMISGKDVVLMIETGIALAVAAIPEGLPVVATMALARGMWRMARRNALVHHLAAVETLGATSVIVADKTGTLTENRMRVLRIAVTTGDVDVTASGLVRDGAAVLAHDDACVAAALEVAVLCNNASLRHPEPGQESGHESPQGSNQGSDQGNGDPLEIALLAAGVAGGVRRADLIARAPEVREEAFDSTTRMMATYHQRAGDGDVRVAVKGAPEAVLACATRVLGAHGMAPLDEPERARWLERGEELARQGLRVLALAEKSAPSMDVPAYRDLVLIGLIGMFDPPRAEVAEPLAACRRAGIRVIMATGDQAITARNIARAVGLTASRIDDDNADQVVLGSALARLDDMSEDERRELRKVSIFARVTPEQKLDIIALHQAGGAIVAMTGDGVNDAPALKKADIGVAMGMRGTDVAREAADMLLKDDSFVSIVAAIHQGRVIFQNIRRFVLYLLSCNTAEVMLVTGAAMSGAALPILPLQILFLNLVTDVFPALALGFGEGDPTIMARQPRDPREPVLARRHWVAIAIYGALITAATFAAFHTARLALDMSSAQAVSISFLTLGFAQVFHVFDMRDRGSRVVANDVVRSPWIWAAIGVCTLLLMAAAYLPVLSDVLAVDAPGWREWAVILGFSLLPTALGQIWLSRDERPGSRR